MDLAVRIGMLSRPSCSFALVSLMLAATPGCASDPPQDAAPTSPAEAQPDPEPEGASAPSEPATGMVADAEAAMAELLVRVDAQLELSPEVREQVRQILAEQLTAMEPHLTAIAAETKRSAKIRVARSRQDQMQAIRSRAETELREVLDPDQYARYEEIRREMRATMKARLG
ncbi:MAG: hypothetical protein AAGF11_33055 [Myxococcota bacterium]